MQKVNLRRNLVAIVSGILIWLFFSLFSHKIDELIINRGFYKYYPLFSLWTYFIIVSFISSFFAGWIGKSKGYIIGLIMQFLITLGLILFFLFSSFVQENLQEESRNFNYAFLNYIFKQLPWFLSASIGGHLGEKRRR